LLSLAWRAGGQMLDISKLRLTQPQVELELGLSLGNKFFPEDNMSYDMMKFKY
jgi:hypothetical protein